MVRRRNEVVQGPSLQPPGSYFDYTLPSPPDTSFVMTTEARGVTLRLLLGLTILLVLATTGVVAYFLFSQRPSHPLAAWLTIFAGLGLCIGITWLFQVMRLRARDAARKADQAREQRDRESASGVTPGDVRARNQRRIDEYNQIAWDQARGSYRNSQIAMAIGLAVLVGGVITTILESRTAAQLVIGVLTGLGSAMSAYLGATFMRAYTQAIDQMNYYYGQPLVHSYLLEAERMSMNPEIDAAARNKVMVQVIEATLSGAAQAAKALTPGPDRRRVMGRRRRKSASESGTASGQDLS
jgi:hypothetical protein